jgi:glycosyltransferase involved in cell wall biosynthesis
VPNPLVSICIPTRNRARSLRNTFDSITRQDYPHLEILISDNASDDDTPQVARDLIATDDRIRYVRHGQNIGLHANHNFCFDAARGEFICIWHDHDAHDLRIVSRYVAFLRQYPRVGVVCSDWDLINDAGETIGVRDHQVKAVTPGLQYIDQTIRSGRTSIGIPGAMVRAEALNGSRFVPDAPIGFGDFPLWCRVAEEWDIGHIPERLWSWRQNRESHSARNIESIARDYRINLDAYCEEHLSRWPEHRALVKRWHAHIRRYLFWALTYEIALSFHHQRMPGRRHTSQSLFEIMDYRLTPEQFQSALTQIRSYRTSALEYAVYGAMTFLIRAGLTWPLAWVTGHQRTIRALLNLQ